MGSRNFCYTTFSSSVRFWYNFVGIKRKLQTLPGCDSRAWKQTLPGLDTCVQGVSKRALPRLWGYVVENCVFLPAEGKQKTTFPPDFTQPGKGLLEIPCTCTHIALQYRVSSFSHHGCATVWGTHLVRIVLHVIWGKPISLGLNFVFLCTGLD